MAARKKEPVTRSTELSGRASIKDALLKVWADVDEGFRNQASRSDDQMDYWDAYDCRLSANQYYNGTSRIFVPIIHNAVNARKTRFLNQLFPKGGRYVEAVTQNGDIPHGEIALMEHYVRRAKLRTRLPALLKNGDVEGQYNVYVSWSTMARHVSWREEEGLEVTKGVKLTKDEGGEDIPTMKSDVVLDEHPVVEVLPDADVLILPATCDSMEEALEQGGSVTIIRRWSKAQIKKMMKDKEVSSDMGELLLEGMAQADKSDKDVAKKHADAAGIKAKGKQCLGYETWTKLKVDGERRLCRAYYGGDELVLGCKLNPYWNDRCPLISAPVEKVSGVVKGVSPVSACVQLQYAANDAINEGMDSAAFALLPIIMTDPLKNPRVNTMILDLAAVWETNPNDTKFAQFPQLWKDAFEIVAAAKNEIFQTLSVNPAMMPQGTGGKQKRNQAEIATEQQVDILTTADAATVLEDDIMTRILDRFAEYDMQFRTEPTLVRAYGYMGKRAAMERVDPQKFGESVYYIWLGVEQARNAAQIQQQIAFLNVLRGIPPQMLPGRRINMTPAIENAVASVFGSRIAPLVFEDLSKEYTYEPDFENEMMADGTDWPISPLDDDQKHVVAHTQFLQSKGGGDPKGIFRRHILHHQMQLQQKAQAQAQQGQPGTPGAGGPGVAGVPRPGGQPAQPKQRGAPGMIHPDRMPAAGAVNAPRRM